MTQRILLLQDSDWGGVHTMCETLTQALSNTDTVITSVMWRHQPWRDLIELAQTHDVLLAAHNFGPTYAALALKAFSGKPVISWVHGPLMDVLHQARAGALKKSFLRWIYRRVDHFVCVSRCTENSLLQFIGANQQANTHVAPNAVAPLPQGKPLHVHVPHTQDETLPPVLLAYVGRLSEEKRPAFLLETLRELPAQFQLVMVGDGPLRQHLSHVGRDLLQQGRLHFLGKHPMSAHLYQPWDMTLLASRYEGCPMTALESMHCGVPCIGLPIPALRELYDLDAPYLLSRGETPIALAETILATISLPRERVQQDIARIVARHQLSLFQNAWQKVLATC